MNRQNIPTLKLSWTDGQYKVNKPGDQSGEYVRVEDMDKLLLQASGMVSDLTNMAANMLMQKNKQERRGFLPRLCYCLGLPVCFVSHARYITSLYISSLSLQILSRH